MKILLIDDHTMVREGLRRLLAEEFAEASFGDAANGAEALECVRAQEWDVVLLDLSLPGRGGLEIMKDLHAIRPKMPILIMTMYGEDQYAVRAFRSGAAGYITKGSSPDELIAAVQKVGAGGKYITEAVGEQLAGSLSGRAGASLHESLSNRELQVLRLLGSGKTVKEIGVELSLSVKTVSTYRTRILEKLNLQTTAQLVRYVVAAGLVE